MNYADTLMQQYYWVIIQPQGLTLQKIIKASSSSELFKSTEWLSQGTVMFAGFISSGNFRQSCITSHLSLYTSFTEKSQF